MCVVTHDSHALTTRRSCTTKAWLEVVHKPYRQSRNGTQAEEAVESRRDIKKCAPPSSQSLTQTHAGRPPSPRHALHYWRDEPVHPGCARAQMRILTERTGYSPCGAHFTIPSTSSLPPIDFTPVLKPQRPARMVSQLQQ